MAWRLGVYEHEERRCREVWPVEGHLLCWPSVGESVVRHGGFTCRASVVIVFFCYAVTRFGGFTDRSWNSPRLWRSLKCDWE
jgi:hypothetical protein